MPASPYSVVVGLDVGGTSINATVLDEQGRFLVDRLVEHASYVTEGPAAAITALADAFDNVLELTKTAPATVRAVGLDTPGPASAGGRISSKGATNFSSPPWHGFDVRSALEERLRLPVVYNNDGNAAALYAHHKNFGERATATSSVSLVVGTGLGGGVVVSGQAVKGAAGMAGELGHVHIPMDGLLREGQAKPVCNCGFTGDGESVASLKGIEKNLLPYWLTQYPDHPLHGMDSIGQAARQVRALAEQHDPMAREIFAQQAMALGRLCTIAANFTDPDAYFIGGGVVETTPEMRDWFLDLVRTSTTLRDEQRDSTTLDLVPDRDMAGARGSALAALQSLPDTPDAPISDGS